MFRSFTSNLKFIFNKRAQYCSVQKYIWLVSNATGKWIKIKITEQNKKIKNVLNTNTLCKFNSHKNYYYHEVKNYSNIGFLMINIFQ